MKWLPWLKSWKKTNPEVPFESPIWLGNHSNGEYFHEQTPQERKLRKQILRQCDENARRVGMDRREFVASTMGMATALAVAQACGGSGSSDGAGGAAGGGAGGAGTGGSAGLGGNGGFAGMDQAQCDEDMARQLLDDQEFFVMDLQSHCIEDADTWQTRRPGQMGYGGEVIASILTLYACNDVPRSLCIGDDKYLDLIFLQSETTVAVLSGFPGIIQDDATLGGHPLGNEFMAFLRSTVNEETGSQRMVQHCQVMPNDRWDLQRAMMENVRNTHGNHGWKVYPPWAPSANGTEGWFMDDPMIADPFFQKTIELTPTAPTGGNPNRYPPRPLICAHKGFPLTGFSPTHADPADVGRAAARWPEIDFIIYHSAFEGGVGNGNGTEYDPSNPRGVDRLIKSCIDNDVAGKNVYAELGSAWAQVAFDPVAATHLIGKLMLHMGEDNVVYGSECVWLGSPQPQIDAFKALQIPADNPWGYPELTRERKAKILGLNAARLYGIDAEEARCKLTTNKLAQLKHRLDGEFGPRRWVFQPPLGPRNRREFMNLWRWKKFTGSPA